MKKRLAKLIDVKSITTIILVIVFAILSIKGDITAQQFIDIFAVVMIFYFGTQAGKKQTTSEE